MQVAWIQFLNLIVIEFVIQFTDSATDITGFGVTFDSRLQGGPHTDRRR